MSQITRARPISSKKYGYIFIVAKIQWKRSVPNNSISIIINENPFRLYALIFKQAVRNDLQGKIKHICVVMHSRLLLVHFYTNIYDSFIICIASVLIQPNSNTIKAMETSEDEDTKKVSLPIINLKIYL